MKIFSVSLLLINLSWDNEVDYLAKMVQCGTKNPGSSTRRQGKKYYLYSKRFIPARVNDEKDVF